MVCSQCSGTGTLFRPKLGKDRRFKKCTECGGVGVKGKTFFGPSEIHIHNLRKKHGSAKGFEKQVKN